VADKHFGFKFDQNFGLNCLSDINRFIFISFPVQCFIWLLFFSVPIFVYSLTIFGSNQKHKIQNLCWSKAV